MKTLAPPLGLILVKKTRPVTVLVATNESEANVRSDYDKKREQKEISAHSLTIKLNRAFNQDSETSVGLRCESD